MLVLEGLRFSYQYFSIYKISRKDIITKPSNKFFKKIINSNINRLKYTILFDSKLLEAIPYINITVGVPKEVHYYYRSYY